MKVVSQAYIDGINGIAKKTSKITYTENGVTKVLNGDKLYKTTLRRNTNLLRTIMKELEFVTDDAIDLETIVNFKFGVYTTNDYEYVDYGNFIVFSCEKQEDANNYKILAYDKMLKAKVEYKTLQHGTFPMTVRSYINNLCLDLGLEFANVNDIFANYNKTIDEDPYENLGYTYFDIFDELSQVTASNIAIDNNDKVEIRYITNSGVTIDEDYLKNYNVSTKEKYGAVNTIVLTRSAGSDSIYYPAILPENPYEIKIEDNQIMNFDDRSDYLPDIYNKLNGLQFYTNDYETYGITYLELCDAYNLQVNGIIYPCVMLNTELIVTDGADELVYTPLPNTNSTKYELADATDRKNVRTSLTLNKQGKNIKALVGRVDNDEKLINGVQLDLNTERARIDVVSTNIDEDTGDILSVRTTKGYTFDADGLKISSEEDEFNSLSNNKGTFYKDGDIILSQFTKDNMIIKDMVLYGKYYYGVPEDLVVENFTKEDAMFVAERFTNNDNEECFGHFWNMED